MSGRRNRSNSFLKMLTKTQQDAPRPRREKSREQIIVEIVKQVCGQTAVCDGDDIASDIVFEIWQDGTLGHDYEEIREIARNKIIKALGSARMREVHSKTRRISDLAAHAGIGDADFLDLRMPITRPMQETTVMAKEALAILLRLPKRERSALSILADGGSPIDIMKETGGQPWEVIQTIKRARDYVGRFDEAA